MVHWQLKSQRVYKEFLRATKKNKWQQNIPTDSSKKRKYKWLLNIWNDVSPKKPSLEGCWVSTAGSKVHPPPTVAFSQLSQGPMHSVTNSCHQSVHKEIQQENRGLMLTHLLWPQYLDEMRVKNVKGKNRNKFKIVLRSGEDVADTGVGYVHICSRTSSTFFFLQRQNFPSLLCNRGARVV